MKDIMRGFKSKWLFSIVAAMLVLLSSGIAQAGQTITLGLYPNVPRPDQFVQSIQTRWQQAHPDVILTIAPSWDGGYDNDPTPAMDVFVFDATFLQQFKQAGFLSPLQPEEVANLADFLPYAINGVQQGGLYYAIPLLGCTNVMFYWKDDSRVAATNNLTSLQQALNSCTYTSDVPPDRRGLMIDGSAGSNNYRYVELYFSQYGKFPASSAPLDEKTLNNGRNILTLGSFLNANTKSSNPYIYSTWFSRSHGRTMVGYTESMSAMSPDMRSRVAFKPMLFSNTNNRPLFYSDVIGINSQTKVRSLAVELANMLASTDNVVASIGASGGQSPQYLMPTRPSVFQKLGGDPLYASIYTMATTSNPVLFALGSDARSWLKSVQTPANHALWANYRCGCDVDAGFVADYARAQRICPSLCESHGGWNGQWTNQIPGHDSVCGCNVCPTP